MLDKGKEKIGGKKPKLTSSSEPDLFDISPSGLPSATSFSSSSISSPPSPSSSAEEVNFTL